jgi:signal transduction histidine kinase
LGLSEPVIAATAEQLPAPARSAGVPLAHLVDLAADVFWDTDARLRFVRVDGDVPAGWPTALDAVEPADVASALAACVRQRRRFRDVECWVGDAAGHRRWYALSGRPRHDGHGGFAGYEGLARDVTETRLSSHRLERREREFDAFARHLAHELRTPIAHVEGLAHLLESRGGDRLDADERQWLALQRRAAQRLRETVDALLQLSRAADEPMPVEPVDLSRLAREVAADFDTLPGDRDVDWQIEDGLRAQASPAALRIVFANLLGNAVKFTRHAPHPIVRVGGRHDADGRLRVWVQDNGAGFDAAQAPRLFVPFARLHAGDDFQGTGIGLSIVRRVVERHGGTVAAHAERGRGARFEFTLQAAE